MKQHYFSNRSVINYHERCICRSCLSITLPSHPAFKTGSLRPGYSKPSILPQTSGSLLETDGIVKIVYSMLIRWDLHPSSVVRNTTTLTPRFVMAVFPHFTPRKKLTTMELSTSQHAYKPTINKRSYDRN